MEIKYLQSLLKRNSNSIAFLEKYAANLYENFVETKNRKHLCAYWDVKRTISKMADMQCVLKKEIAEEIEMVRFLLNYQEEIL